MLVFFQALVPDVHVEMVSIMSINGQGFYLCVRPDHREWWIQFQARHPEFISLAHVKYNTVRKTEDGLPYLCLVFTSRKDLIRWLADVFSLSYGVRNLIQLVLV